MLVICIFHELFLFVLARLLNIYNFSISQTLLILYLFFKLYLTEKSLLLGNSSYWKKYLCYLLSIMRFLVNVPSFL